MFHTSNLSFNFKVSTHIFIDQQHNSLARDRVENLIMSYFRALIDPGYPGMPSRKCQAWVHHRSNGHSIYSYDDDGLMQQYHMMQRPQRAIQMGWPMPPTPLGPLPYGRDDTNENHMVENQNFKDMYKQFERMMGLRPPAQPWSPMMPGGIPR